MITASKLIPRIQALKTDGVISESLAKQYVKQVQTGKQTELQAISQRLDSLVGSQQSVKFRYGSVDHYAAKLRGGAKIDEPNTEFVVADVEASSDGELSNLPRDVLEARLRKGMNESRKAIQ